MTAISFSFQGRASADAFYPTASDLKAAKRATEALQKDKLDQAARQLNPIADRSCEGAAWAARLCLPYPTAGILRVEYGRLSDPKGMAESRVAEQKAREVMRNMDFSPSFRPWKLFDWGRPRNWDATLHARGY